MNILNQIAKNTGLQIISKILSTILGLVAIAFVARALGTEQFGWYTTASSFVQFIGIFADFGFMLVTSQMLAQNQFKKITLLNTLFTWRLITAIVLYGLAGSLIWLFPYQIEIKIATAIISFSFFFITLNQVFTGYFQYKLKMLVPAIGEVLGRLFLVTGILLIYFGNFDKTFFSLMTIISLASFIFFLYLLKNSPKIKLKIDKTITKVAFSKMWPLAISIMFNAFYLLGDRVILPLYVTQTEVGLYGASYRVLDILLQIIALSMAIILPLLSSSWAENKLTEFKERMQISFDFLALTTFPMIAGVIALSTPIMNFVAGSEFTKSGKILSVLIFAIIGIYFGQIGGHLMLSMNKQKKSLIVFITTAILGIISYFIFIPKYGVWGAAGVTIGTELFAGIILISLSIYYAKYIPKISTLLKIILSSTLMGLLVFYIPSPHITISIILGILIYSGLILTLKAVQIQTLKELFNKQS